MKKLLTVIVAMIALNASAQNSKFEKALMKNVSMMDTASNIATWQTLTNNVERMAAAEPKEWLAQYYSAFSNIMLGVMQKENTTKDSYYDRAISFIDKADSMMPNNSEIYALRGFALSVKIGVDPMQRGMTLGPQSGMYISKAKELDPANPRAWMLQGQSAMYTPEQFGGGKAKALPLLETAVEKYKNFKSDNPVMPHWGERRTKDVLEQCKNM